LTNSALRIARIVMKVTGSASHHLARAALPHVDVIQLWTSLTQPCVGTRLITRTALVRHRLVDERASRAHPLRQVVWLQNVVIVLIVRLQLHLVAEQSYHGSIYLVSLWHAAKDFLLLLSFFSGSHLEAYEGTARVAWNADAVWWSESCPNVCLSVKRVDCVKTESVHIFIPYERAFSLVFCDEEWSMGRPLLPDWVNWPRLERNRRFWTNIRSIVGLRLSRNT